ncbi:carbohydrate ABC transporter permease [Anaerocolumna xylanovorans]|uniref:Multiple sugar transport system permease protein n=1 Tax=Anaerocolumna xylanovorans DSM 12503 TaxID=1121345 RepID=A0A1M7Y8C7_9FIRM|nr:sugar ABC transporter permease [Anaerocolumna xylanovorans]SHO48894.1 multiple sugar transport system permease protein [Anaerocolumna xylanovorans DSM 12503]
MKDKNRIMRKQNLIGRLFVAPPVLLFLIFTLLPMAMAIGLSFTDYDIINAPKFSGLHNFKKMIHDEFFWIALRNTCYYTVLYVPLGLLLSLGTALFLNSERRMVGLFRTLFYLPVLSSSVATATLWFWILNPQLGLLNGILGIFGIDGPAWLYDSKLAMLSIVMMSLWAGFGGNMMIFLSGLKGIPGTYYEAAKVEGAGRLQRFRYITMPSLTKTTFLVSTMLIIGTFQVFDQAFVLTKGGPGNATITLVYYIYNNGFNNLNMGYASAISLVLFLIIVTMTIINQKINKAEI